MLRLRNVKFSLIENDCFCRLFDIEKDEVVDCLPSDLKSAFLILVTDCLNMDDDVVLRKESLPSDVRKLDLVRELFGVLATIDVVVFLMSVSF